MAPVTVQADRIRVAQVLDNVVGNALPYTPPGGHVALEASRDGHWAVLAVRDDGPGLDAEQAARVFERFYRVPGWSALSGGILTFMML